MTFFKSLQDIKLTPLTLLDMSYIAVLLPLLLILKVPMLVFLFIVVVILFLKKEPSGNLGVLFIFILGIIAVYLSLYGAFSFRGLSRLKLFLELLVYVLLVVVSMQRLTQKINFYLLISPMLFLALSLFFFHGLSMLIYVVFEIFFLLWMVLSHRMEGRLSEGFRSSMVMFMYSLPWVVVLFVFFPRISFEHATYGFKGETEHRMGHDGTMYLDNKAQLVPSTRIVMEVGFDENVPTSSALYFRGSILYVDKKNHWEPMPSYVKRKNRPQFKQTQKKTYYKVTLYPTQKRWLYLLDMPYEKVKLSTLDTDLITTVKNPIAEPIHYAASSFLIKTFNDVLDAKTKEIASTYDKAQNPKTYKEAQKIKVMFTSDEQRAKAVIDFFKAQSLSYSLKPEVLDMKHSTDSFLFDKHKGYCVHFASSFVTMARMVGIPSRIVTGYKADMRNALKNYLAVKENDAHAWAELYINGAWIRIETTSTASIIEADTQRQLEEAKGSALYKSINLYLMYAKYQVETWILYYSNIRQLQLLKYAKNNPKIILYFVSSLILLVVLTFMIITYFKRPHFKNKTIASLQPLLQKLKKNNIIRKEKETLHQFFMRILSENVENKKFIEVIGKIDTLYERISYAKEDSSQQQKALKALIKDFKSVNLA